MMQISQGTIGTPWHQNYHSSSSTSDVSNYSHAYPRRSPDQYSSQGSMESLDHSGNYPPCHLLSPAKSISSIDQLTHLHNKRDSAYSSFSTSSSIIEYPPTSFSSQECSDTVATTPAQGSLLEGMRQADIRYVKTVYDSKRGISAEYEVNSSALLPPSGESQESMGDQDYDKWHNHPRSGRVPLLSWNQQCSSSHETDSNNLPHKVGAPMPPARSGSYTILRHYERPSSWSSSEHNRYGRPQSSFPGTLKTSFPEEHLHTLLEKSPENSPPVKPKQSYTQTTQPGQPMLPTSIYPVPSPEPHFAQMPQSSVSSNGMLYPALIKEHGYTASLNTSDKIATLENGNQNGPSKNAVIFYQAPDYNSPPLVEKVETLGKFFSYKPHFISDSENLRGTSLRKDEPRISEGDYMLPSGKEGLCDNVQFSNHHTPRGLKIDESKLLSRPSEPKRAEFQESPNARLQTRPEREDLTEDSWNTSGKTSSSFLSLQPISPSTRRQNSQEIQVGPQEGNPDNRTACLINMSKMEQEPKKTVLERRDHSDQQTSRGRPEGGTKGPSSSHNSEPRHEVHRQTSNLTQRQFSSGNALHISHYGKPHFSVLEKVNKFEQREQGNWRPSSVSSYIYKTNNLERPPSRGSSMISLENHQREISFQEPSPSIGSINVGENLVKDSKKKPEAVSWYLPEHQLKRAGDGGHGLTHSESKSLKSAPLLQRSQSTFHLSNKVEEETLWRENRSSSPESPVFEVPLNQAYRNSIKDAQSRVLGATSFRRRDLDLGPSVASRARQRARQRPASAHLGLRSPETTSMSASPHIPKERHNITPTEGSPPRESPAALVARVGGRKRLTTDQKKRSYSEPEKINEVGVSGAGEPSACYPQRKDVPFGFPENTVANRRRIFEREGKACSTLNLSKPELKQFQQTALADYIQRKTGKRPSSSSGHRPESHSLNAASSMNSLQEQSPIPRRGSATLSIELIENLERNSPEAQVGPRDRSSSSASSHLRAERHWHPKMEPAQVLWLGEASGQPSHPQKVTWAPEKPFSLGTTNRGASKSMSAEDLLDRSDVLTVPFHSRSRSSPISDKKCQDMLLRGNSDYSLLGKVPSSLVGPGFRQFSHSGRSHEEKSSLPHYPGPHLGPHTVPNGSSVPMECSKILDSQRPTSRSSAFGPPLAAKQGPFVSAQTSGTNSTYSPRPYLHTERDVLAGRQPSPKQPQNPRNLEENSVEDLAENDIKKNKGPLPQRPPPPRVKWSQSLREDNLPEPSLPFGVPSQKHYPQHQSLSSTSTTCHPNSLPGLLTVTGKGSLPISESAFRAIPLPQEEDDDEVFVQESRPRPTPNPTFKTLPLLPPPPPPPSPPPLDLKAQDSNLEDFPPPPPPITYEALGTLSSETYEEETCTSKSKMMLAASQRASTSRPSSFIKTLGAKQTNLLSPLAAQNQPIGILGEQSSPEQMLPTQFPKLIQKPNNLTQELAKGSPGPEKTLEDISTETLAKQIVHQDKSLADILDPDSRMKTTMDLMEGLFPQGPSFLKENNIRKKAIQRIASFPVSEGKRSTEKERVGMLINCPAYYNVSAPKAELLNKLKSMPAEGDEDEDQLDVNEKKAKLIRSLRHKLESLKEAKESLFMDIKLNNALGEEVEVLVCKLCKPNELDKYKMFVGDLDKVVNLLLSLSGRLARVENVLSGLGEDADSEEWSSLNEKKKVLAGQHEDARELKENLDRRERVVLDILANYLTTEQLQDYQHFVKMKSTLLIEQRKLDDKIKLGQEQLNCLLESLPRDFLTEARTPAAPLTPETEMTPDGDCTFRSGLPPLISSL